jgi:hypothetical protein
VPSGYNTRSDRQNGGNDLQQMCFYIAQGTDGCNYHSTMACVQYGRYVPVDCP